MTTNIDVIKINNLRWYGQVMRKVDVSVIKVALNMKKIGKKLQ